MYKRRRRERNWTRGALFALSSFFSLVLSDVLTLLFSVLPSALTTPEPEVVGLRNTFFYLALVRPALHLLWWFVLLGFYTRTRVAQLYTSFPRRKWRWCDFFCVVFVTLVIDAVVGITWAVVDAGSSADDWRTDDSARRRLLGVHAVFLLHDIIQLQSAVELGTTWRLSPMPTCVRNEADLLCVKLTTDSGEM